MGLFTEKKEYKFKPIPDAPEQTEARAYLQNLYQTSIGFPVLQIADLTPEEQMIQSKLPDYFASSEDAYNQARSYYADILSGKYNPLTSPYYQGMRTNIEARKKAAIQASKQAGQGAGVLKSGPTAALAAENERMYNADIGTLEGQLLESERTRMGGAAAAIPSLEQSRLATMGGISDLAKKARDIQDAKYAATYNAAIQTLLAPYERNAFMGNAAIAQALLNEPRYEGVETGGGLTDLGFLTQNIASMFGSYMKAGGGGGA